LASSDEHSEPPAGGERGEQPASGGDAAAARHPRERRALHEIVHLWIPLAIVVASVLAAAMGWRASLADESATHTAELSRQNRVQQQQLLIEDNDTVAGDIRTYGQFAQYSALAHSLLHDAGQVGGKVGDRLMAEGQADLGIALYLGKQIRFLNYSFDPSSPTGNSLLRTDGTLRPGNAYNAALGLDVAENLDTELHGLAPDRLLAQSETEHTTGVRLTGIAALFVAVMVLLTIAALISGAAKVWLASSGVALIAVGLVLFAIVELS
jgi:hypothetical protein